LVTCCTPASCTAPRVWTMACRGARGTRGEGEESAGWRGSGRGGRAWRQVGAVVGAVVRAVVGAEHRAQEQGRQEVAGWGSGGNGGGGGGSPAWRLVGWPAVAVAMACRQAGRQWQ
jgi:hypothetical protein